MTFIKDNHGYSQGFKPSKTMDIRTERRCDYMVSQMDLTKNNIAILEIGCGTGDISYLLSQKTNAEIIGTDICLSFIEKSRKKYNSLNLSYEVLDFNNIGSVNRIIRDKKFDYIVGNGILHHLFHKLDDALININRLLKNDGKMIFLEPNILNPYCFLIFKFSFFRKMTELEPGEMAFTKKFILKKLKKNKYKDIKIEYKDFLIPGTPPFLIKPMITIGKLAEKTPLVKKISQSIFITASKL